MLSTLMPKIPLGLSTRAISARAAVSDEKCSRAQTLITLSKDSAGNAKLSAGDKRYVQCVPLRWRCAVAISRSDKSIPTAVQPCVAASLRVGSNLQLNG